MDLRIHSSRQPNKAFPLKTILYISELCRITDAAQRKGIVIVFLKGILQDFFLTKKISTKNRFDIDILVQDGQLPAISNIFNASGYSMALPISKRTPTLEHALTDSQSVFIKKIQRILIVFDVHTLLLVPTPPPIVTLSRQTCKKITREVFTRKQSMTFKGKRVFILETTDMLLHQCLNLFFHHSCKGMEQVNTVATICGLSQINWKEAVTRLKRWNIVQFGYFPLWLAKSLFGAPVPSMVLQSLYRNSIGSKLAKFFINSSTVTQPIDHKVRYRYNMFLRFLLSDKSWFLKTLELLHPAVLLKILAKPLPVIRLIENLWK